MNKKTTTETKNISFKIDAKLHKRVKKYCEKNNITIKDYIINYLIYMIQSINVTWKFQLLFTPTKFITPIN